MIYTVYEKDGSFYVKGLVDDNTEQDYQLVAPNGNDNWETKLTSLRLMHAALYDLIHVEIRVRNGDIFITYFGMFKCIGEYNDPGRNITFNNHKET
jgi:hypothetical protein